jgi:hypothetical protein
MTTLRNLMGTGSSPLNAQAMATGILSNSLTATGNSQGTALMLPSDFCVFTTVGASTGAIMPSNCLPGDWFTVVNHGASTLSLYPPTGGTIANGSANAAFSVAANKMAQVICISPTSFAASVSA